MTGVDAGVAARRAWDVVVIGAGPAGATSALRLSRAGLDVLLVDRRAFPRPKVCGSCLSGAAWTCLERLGAARRLRRPAPVPLRGLRLAGWGRQATLPLDGGVAVSREALDTALVEAAGAAGATFLSGCRAVPRPVTRGGARVAIEAPAGAFDLRCRAVVVATGLRGASGAVESAPAPRIGAGCILDEAPAEYVPGCVFMGVGADGYVGLVRLEDGRLDVAAALDAAAVRAAAGPAAVVSSVLATAGLSAIDGLRLADWGGTPTLRRQPAARASERLFRVGDAAGYVEPFTGEGIAWAIESALLAAPIVVEATRHWHPGLGDRWERLWRHRIGRRQRACRTLSWLLRHPRLSRCAMSVLERSPSVADPLVRRFAAPAVATARI